MASYENSPSGHVVALKYIRGEGKIPTDEQCEGLRDNLYWSVKHVSELECKIDAFEEEVTRLQSDNARLRTEMANGVKPANIELIDTPESQLIGQSTPCGQIMCVIHPGGPKIFVKCIIPGMPAFNGKCPIHAAHTPIPKESSAASPGATSAPASAQSPSYASIVAKK